MAGWSYPDWRDTVYRLPPEPSRQLSLFGDLEPPDVKERHVQDPLPFLASYLDMVEVNTSFYRTPSRTTVEQWHDRLREFPEFFFSAKLNQIFTHEFRRDTGEARAFLHAFEPLIESGRLHAFLAQFRYDFAFTPNTMEIIKWMVDQFHTAAPMVLEVRHRSWEHPVAFEWLLSHGVMVAVLDYPTTANSFDLRRTAPNTHAYFRLHGRNREAWFASGTASHEPYDYDYSDAEIEELTMEARALLSGAKSLTVVANNHYRGKAVSAALRLKASLLRQQVAVPPALLDEYPGLKKIALPLS